MKRIPLGPFDLEEPVGHGGMGVVWRGRHRDSGVMVAVKVINRTAQGDDQLRAFHNEIRAIARLDHPGIVWVFEATEVDARAARASGGYLIEGSPYIAMEYASRGTLRDRTQLPWPALRSVLLALLDALAHAHARGVVHRDIKPANVLICGAEDLRPGLKLADFGIAHALERTDITMSNASAIGTLHYMAPEQIRAEEARYGPWTDLYAVGNLAWHLAAGRLPFQRYTGMALIKAQLQRPIPPLDGVQVPDGFRDWLKRATEKNPKARFQRAADAAAALLELDDQTSALASASGISEDLPTVPIRVPPELLSGDLESGPRTLAIEGEDDDETDTAVVEGAEGIEAEQGDPLVSLSLRLPQGLGTGVRVAPDSWRRPTSRRRSLQLLGAGLGLWGLRQPPMVGREEERDALWSELGAVCATGAGRVVCITGAAGTGKSRLARWLCERAHEVGAATPLRARFTRDEDEDAPLRRMWMRHFEMRRLDQEARLDHLDWWLDRLGISGGAARFEALYGPGEAATRHVLSRIIIDAMSRERPVVVWLDDVHDGLDGLRFARHLVDAWGQRDVPVLVLLTARSEALVASPTEREHLETLLEAPRARRLPLGPLEPRDHATLVEEMLGLSPQLAAQVVERTRGNPLFAVELIGDWVQRGLLTLGPSGFGIRRGEVAELPRSVSDVWSEQVDRVLAGLAPGAELLLERAAVLGLEVDDEEWQQVCDDPDGGWAAMGRVKFIPDNARLRADVVDRLADQRLAKTTPEGFVFAHAMIRESLLSRARQDPERWAEHHKACANMLSFKEEDDPGNAERVGRHLLEAGELEGALEPLLRGVRWRQATSGTRGALSLLATAEEALRRLRLSQEDPRWGEVWNLRASLSVELGRIGQAQRHIKRVLASADRYSDWASAAVEARLTLARVHLDRGDLDTADRVLRDVLDVSSEAVQQGLALAQRAVIAAQQGRSDDARQNRHDAVRKLRRAASSRALADCWRLVGTTALIEGSNKQAEDALARGLRLYKRMRHLVGQAQCLAGLGRAAARRSEIELAEERFKEAIHLYELTGSSEVVVPQLDLATVQLRTGRYREAQALLSVVRLAAGSSMSHKVAGLSLLQLTAAAALGDWEDFDHQLSRVEEERVDGDPETAAWALSTAAKLARRAGKRQRAVKAEALTRRVGSPRT